MAGRSAYNVPATILAFGLFLLPYILFHDFIVISMDGYLNAALVEPGLRHTCTNIIYYLPIWFVILMLLNLVIESIRDMSRGAGE